MSRTFRDTPFKTAYHQETRNRLVREAVETPGNEKALDQDRWINGYDRRGYGVIGMADRRSPRGYNYLEEIEKPRHKRSEKRLTSRIRRLIGQDVIRGELSAMAEA